MAPTQGEARIGKVSLAFLKTGRNIGKWLQGRFSPVHIIVHGKVSHSASDYTSERRNTSSSITTQLPTDSQLPTSMSTDERGHVLPLQPSDLNLYANLPPPPPPPPLHYAGPPLISPATPVEQRDGLSEGKRAEEFSEIEQQHDKIVATREDLMGCRFQMKIDRNKIREIREKTGAREGSMMNQLRTFLHKQNVVLPSDIEETFEQIDALRDQLGLLEAEYDSSEQDYTMKEVEYSGHETEFIDKLRCVHSHRPAVSTFVPNQTNSNTVDRAPVNPPLQLEMIKQSNEACDATSSEKALQLVVQTKVHPEDEEVDKSQARDIVLFTNKKSVDAWLVNTIFQSPIPQVYPEELEQNSEKDEDSLSEQGWYWLGTIGAQFQGEEMNDSHGRFKEDDNAFSSNGTISCSKPVLVLHTKDVRSS